jgi:hypothetical protein
VRRLVAANEAARFTAVVVFPTPPFWFATAITRFIRAQSVAHSSRKREARELIDRERGSGASAQKRIKETRAKGFRAATENAWMHFP